MCRPFQPRYSCLYICCKDISVVPLVAVKQPHTTSLVQYIKGNWCQLCSFPGFGIAAIWVPPGEKWCSSCSGAIRQMWARLVNPSPISKPSYIILR